MKYLYTLIVYLLCHFTTYAQENCNFTYSGEVTNIHDSSPIIDATIHLKELDKYTTTDFDGKFTFNDLCSGSYTFEISHLSSKTKSIKETIDGNSFGKITLEEHAQALEEVTVKGSSSGGANSLKKSTVKAETLEKYSSGSMGDALKEVSGVSTLSTGNAIVKPVINGLHSSRVVIMNNNVRMQDQDWGADHAPNVDLNSAGSISVIKGAGALAYSGDAIGGVVVLNPMKPITADSLYGKVMVNGQTQSSDGKYHFQGYSGNASLSKTFENHWYATGQGSYKSFADFAAANYNLSNTGTKSMAYSFNAGRNAYDTGFHVYYSFVANEIGILSAAHIGGAADLARSINNRKPLFIKPYTDSIKSPKQDVKHHLAKASFNHNFENFGKLKLQYDFQNNRRLEFDNRVGDLKGIASVDLVLKTHTATFDFKLEPFSNNKFNFGALYRFQDNFANPATGVKRLIPDYTKVDIGAYITAKFDISDNTTIDAGWRYDYNNINAYKYYEKARWDELYAKDFKHFEVKKTKKGKILTNPRFNYDNVSTSVGLKQRIGNKASLMINYSLSNRAPNPSELFSEGLHHSAARIEIGDLNIKQETAHRFSGSFEYTGKYISLSLEPYLNRIDNFIFIQPVGFQNTLAGEYPLWDYLQTNALLLGADASVNIAFTKNWSLSNNSAFLQGDDLKTNKPLIDIPPFNTKTTLSYASQKWPKFESNLKSELVFKQTRFPNNNFETRLPETGEYILVDISTPPDGYHLMHFDSSITFKINKNSKLNVGLQVNNLLNTEYRDYLNRLRYFADDIGRNIMLNTKFNF